MAGDKLVVAANGDRCLKTVDLATKKVTPVATLTLGIIDGVKSDAEGNYLVSINDGRLVRVSPEGQVTTLLDTTAVRTNIADFDYIPEKKMLVAADVPGQPGRRLHARVKPLARRGG